MIEFIRRQKCLWYEIFSMQYSFDCITKITWSQYHFFGRIFVIVELCVFPEIFNFIGYTNNTKRDIALHNVNDFWKSFIYLKVVKLLNIYKVGQRLIIAYAHTTEYSFNDFLYVTCYKMSNLIDTHCVFCAICISNNVSRQGAKFYRRSYIVNLSALSNATEKNTGQNFVS